MNSETDNSQSSLGITSDQNQRDFSTSEKQKLSIEEILNKYFLGHSDATREILHTWFLFALSTKGRTFQSLDETQFAEFKTLLENLLTDLYPGKEETDAS